MPIPNKKQGESQSDFMIRGGSAGINWAINKLKQIDKK